MRRFRTWRVASAGFTAAAIAGFLGVMPVSQAVAEVSATHAGLAPATVTVLKSSCGALRDIPSQWTPVHSDNPLCGSSFGFSYILTSPSNVHFATWSFAPDGVTATSGDYTVQAWIPAEDAGADTEFEAQYCGVSGWTDFGTINQETSTGWTATSGKVPLNDSVPLCAIREVNIGSGTWDLAEDALEILKP
jgi:hypothetical protein